MHALVHFYYINDLLFDMWQRWWLVYTFKSFIVDSCLASVFQFFTLRVFLVYCFILFLSKIYLGLCGFQIPSGM